MSLIRPYKELSIGDKVFLKAPVSYLKTSDPMPMLRPPDLVSLEETGEVVGFRGIGTLEVKFRRGTFLIPIDHVARIGLNDIAN